MGHHRFSWLSDFYVKWNLETVYLVIADFLITLDKLNQWIVDFSIYLSCKSGITYTIKRFAAQGQVHL